MSRTKDIPGICQRCGAAFVFPAEHIGLTADCPQCGKTTELLLAPPRDEPVIPRRALAWTAAGCVVLLLGLGLSLIALKKAQHKAAEKPAATIPASPTPQR